MSLIKNALDYILWDILRLRRPKYRGRQVSDGLDGSRPATVTLRTYTEGGDPFDDLIVFHLRNSPGVPSGFREPGGIKDGHAPQEVNEADIRRALGVKD